jgi:hypothetical protein
LVVEKVKERLAVSKQAAQQFDVERFNLRNLSELEVKKRYQIMISERFAALENLNDGEDINRAWENIKENIKTSAGCCVDTATRMLSAYTGICDVQLIKLLLTMD